MKRRKDILMNAPRDGDEKLKTPVQNDINQLLITAMNYRQTTSGAGTEIKKPRLDESNPNTPQRSASIRVSPPPFPIKKQHKNLQQCESNPDTPDTQHSISPPPYSPLTPLMLLKRKKEEQMGKEELSGSNLPFRSNLSQPGSPQIQNEEPASSPLRSMSPKTKELFDVLNDSCEDINNDFNSSDIIEDIEDLTFGNGSDDSVDDPDFIASKSEVEDFSDTESNDSVYESVQNSSEKVIKNTISRPKNEKGNNIENTSDNESIVKSEKEGLRLSITECENADTNCFELPGKENHTQLQTTKNNIEDNTDTDGTPPKNKKQTQLLATETDILDAAENDSLASPSLLTSNDTYPDLIVNKAGDSDTKSRDSVHNSDLNNSERETELERGEKQENSQNVVTKNTSPPKNEKGYNIENTSDDNRIANSEKEDGLLLSITECKNADTNSLGLTGKENHTQLKTTKNNIEDNTDTDGILPEKEKETQLLATETDILDTTENYSLASPSLLTSNDIIGNNSILHQNTPNQQTEDQIENAEMTGRPKKGRKRKHGLTRAERKEKKYNNLEYTTQKNRKIDPKTFIDHKCSCLKKCYTLVSAEKRKQVFEKYVNMGSYNAQLALIASLVKEKRKKRCYTMVDVPPERKKPKQFIRTYTLSGVEVCREMFLKTLQVTTQKITITLKKIRNNELLQDNRGKSAAGWNKISEEDFNFVVNIIAKLPKYESHYRRGKNSDALYLSPGMTVAKIYEQYQKEFIETFGNDRARVSLSKFKQIFMSKFNLRCKSLKKDTCNKCDTYAVKIQNANSSEEKAAAENEKTLHLDKATKLRDQMNEDFEKALTSDTTECLSFDLEKTLPLPRIPTNIAFYKRQLWLYNSGIHSASDDVGHCYIWVEGEAGRGAQEVGSCLIKYLEHKLRPTAEHLILWSDCCGGQNRNIKVILMLKAYLNEHPKLKTISFRYLESGHTFLPNDTDFSKIETALKNHQRLYTPEDYIGVIKTARKTKPLQVYRMQKTDFYSVENIEKNIVNRKKFKDKSKVNWLQTKEILIKKDELYSIFMRTSIEEEYKELRVEKKIKGELRPIDKADMQLLWPNGKPIAPAKLADLESMYHLIPNDCLLFYQQLKASDQISDDVDGYGGQPDFEIEEMED